MKILFSLILLSLSTYAFSAELVLHSSNKILLKKLDKNTFEKINEVSIVKTMLKTSLGNNVNENKYVNDDKMTIIAGNNLVHITDLSAGIDKDVPAHVERSLIVNNIKSITIASESLENAYYETLEKQGYLALASLDLQKNNRKSLNLSNQSCVAEKESSLMTCSYDLDLRVENNGVVLGAALISLQLGSKQN